ncbi:DUF4236 domain-containing protein [Tardiphaga sp. 71_E8_N1_1]|uniref:DUF4236 domain-containing protein n=1 Tax=Tardiphaga sp. 71_E8_N1_1 TaxID=3240784 RepID=UPI003F89D4ED
MGVRFRKSVKLMPGVRVNFGLKSVSISMGGAGATYNVGSRGSRVTLGIPGSGLSYSADVTRQSQAVISSAVVPIRRFSIPALAIILFILGVAYVLVASGDTTSPQSPPATTSAGFQEIAISSPQSTGWHLLSYCTCSYSTTETKAT